MDGHSAPGQGGVREAGVTDRIGAFSNVDIWWDGTVEAWGGGEREDPEHG